MNKYYSNVQFRCAVCNYTNLVYYRVGEEREEDVLLKTGQGHVTYCVPQMLLKIQATLDTIAQFLKEFVHE